MKIHAGQLSNYSQSQINSKVQSHKKRSSKFSVSKLSNTKFSTSKLSKSKFSMSISKQQIVSQIWSNSQIQVSSSKLYLFIVYKSKPFGKMCRYGNQKYVKHVKSNDVSQSQFKESSQSFFVGQVNSEKQCKHSFYWKNKFEV